MATVGTAVTMVVAVTATTAAGAMTKTAIPVALVDAMPGTAAVTVTVSEAPAEAMTEVAVESRQTGTMTVVVDLTVVGVVTATVAGNAILIVAAGRIGNGSGTERGTVVLAITEKEGEEEVEEGAMTMADSSAALRDPAPRRLRGTLRIATVQW